MRKFPNLTPSRLRYSLDAMSNEQRKAIRLPHVGAKEIAKHERRAEIAVAKRARVDARIDAIAARYPERTPEERRAIMEANNFYESGVYIV